jgi:hypothetical protein
MEIKTWPQLALNRRVGFFRSECDRVNEIIGSWENWQEGQRPPKSANASPKRERFGNRPSKIITRWVLASQGYEQQQWLASSRSFPLLRLTSRTTN